MKPPMRRRAWRTRRSSAPNGRPVTPESERRSNCRCRAQWPRWSATLPAGRSYSCPTWAAACPSTSFTKSWRRRLSSFRSRITTTISTRRTRIYGCATCGTASTFLPPSLATSGRLGAPKYSVENERIGSLANPGAYLRRLWDRGGLARKHRPRRRRARGALGDPTGLGALRRRVESPLPAIAGAGATRRDPLDPARRPTPHGAREDPVRFWRHRPQGRADRAPEPRVASARSLARCDCWPYPAQAQVHPRHALQWERGASGQHGQARRSAVGCDPRRRGRAPLQAATRGVSAYRGFAGAPA